jgi:hypothetical protein
MSKQMLASQWRIPFWPLLHYFVCFGDHLSDFRQLFLPVSIGVCHLDRGLLFQIGSAFLVCRGIVIAEIIRIILSIRK